MCILLNLSLKTLQNEGLTDADQWEPFVKEYDPDIRILLCDNCEDNPSKGVSKLSGNNDEIW